jgi:pentatricopeptide repeat protein
MAIPVIVAISVALGVGVCRDYRSDLLLEAGRRTIERGNLVGALALFEKSRALAFRPAEALFYLGFTSLQGGDAQQAAAYLERSLRDRVTEDTYLFLAQAYAQVGNVEEAWEVLDRLLATEPHPSRKVLAYYLRAQLLQATGNYDMAVAQLGHVLSQGPPLLRIQAHLLTADIHVELGRPDLAAESYQRALDETAAELAKKSGVRVFLLNSPSVPIAELAEVDEDIAWLEDAFRRAHEGLVEVGKEAD